MSLSENQAMFRIGESYSAPGSSTVTFRSTGVYWPSDFERKIAV